jgi:ribosomal protein L37AE/L43A
MEGKVISVNLYNNIIRIKAICPNCNNTNKHADIKYKIIFRSCDKCGRDYKIDLLKC